MGLINKIEDLVFGSQTLASVEIVRNRIIIIKAFCHIEHLNDHECFLRTAGGTKYQIYGTALQIKEYGDTYVKVEGQRVTSFLIEAVGGEVSE